MHAQRRSRLPLCGLALLLLATGDHARAEEAPPVAPAEPAQTPPRPPPAQPPYSLPYQLRSALAATNVRLDNSFAIFHGSTPDHGLAVVNILTFAYQVLDWQKKLQVAPFVRIALTSNHPPGTTPNGVAFGNPIVGAALSLKLPYDLRLACYLSLAIPVGMGGGDTPDPGAAAANQAGLLARAALDNSLFAVDYLVVIPGVDLAWTRFGLTVQIEATIFENFRVRGAAVERDEFRTNFTTGLHVAYFVIPQLSVGAELRYQRWLTTPSFVPANPPSRDNLSFAAGVRGHFKFADRFWLRPALVYAHGLDDPLVAQGYNIVELDGSFYF